MNIFNVVLEGKDFNKFYFISYDVYSETKDEAIFIAKNQAKKKKLNIINVEEAQLIKGNINCKKMKIKKEYGKVFFDS